MRFHLAGHGQFPTSYPVWLGVEHMVFATDFPHIECDWPNTRPFAEKLFAGLPADEAFKIAAGNVLDFFHLADTPMGKRVTATRCPGRG